MGSSGELWDGDARAFVYNCLVMAGRCKSIDIWLYGDGMFGGCDLMEMQDSCYMVVW